MRAYTATIEVAKNATLVAQVLSPDMKSMDGDRARVTIHRKKSGVTFQFSANDPTALRAAMNNVLKALQVVDKMGDITKR